MVLGTWVVLRGCNLVGGIVVLVLWEEAALD